MTRRLLVVVVSVLALLRPGPAEAHALLFSADPEDGATLAQPPRQVELAFTVLLSDPAYIRVTGPEGQNLSQGDPVIEEARAVQPVRDDAGPGDYRIAYQVVSTDGHRITGAVRFRVETTGAAEAAQPSVVDRAGVADGAATTDAGRGPWWSWAVAALAALTIGTVIRRRRSR